MWLWINVPLMVMFFALWVGIPTWLVLRHPDRKPALASAPAIRTLPRSQSGHEDSAHRRVA